MPITKTLQDLPAGISLTGALPDENLLMSTTDFLTSEDGNDFVSRLEAVWGFFEEALQPTGVHPSQVDHFLAFIDRNCNATMYCNELQQRALVQAKRTVEPGQAVFKDDISDIVELVFQDRSGNEIVVPPDNAVVLILSVGWRKCLYYDFQAASPNSPPRSNNMSRMFGMFHRQLTFQELFSITDQQWDGMLNQGWFPFAWMSGRDRRNLIQFSVRTSEPTALLEEICHSFRGIVLDRIASWNRLSLFQKHTAFIDAAAKHYLSGDFISAIQVLYPRIEGLMRQLHLLKRPGQKAHQKSMVESLVTEKSSDSLLLPLRFQEYLSKFYFRNFDEGTGDVSLSRNSVAHGAARADDFNLIRASLGFMILDQMFYFLFAFETPRS